MRRKLLPGFLPLFALSTVVRPAQASDATFDSSAVGTTDSTKTHTLTFRARPYPETEWSVSLQFGIIVMPSGPSWRSSLSGRCSRGRPREGPCPRKGVFATRDRHFGGSMKAMGR
jgi:hypothetical protein